MASSSASVLNMFSLEGHTAVVTGGTRGIGQAVAVGLAEAGADILLIQASKDDLKFIHPSIIHPFICAKNKQRSKITT